MVFRKVERGAEIKTILFQSELENLEGLCYDFDTKRVSTVK
jgi:hypothetical protein